MTFRITARIKGSSAPEQLELVLGEQGEADSSHEYSGATPTYVRGRSYILLLDCAAGQWGLANGSPIDAEAGGGPSPWVAIIRRYSEIAQSNDYPVQRKRLVEVAQSLREGTGLAQTTVLRDVESSLDSPDIRMPPQTLRAMYDAATVRQAAILAKLAEQADPNSDEFMGHLLFGTTADVLGLRLRPILNFFEKRGDRTIVSRLAEMYVHSVSNPATGARFDLLEALVRLAGTAEADAMARVLIAAPSPADLQVIAPWFGDNLPGMGAGLVSTRMTEMRLSRGDGRWRTILAEAGDDQVLTSALRNWREGRAGQAEYDIIARSPLPKGEEARSLVLRRGRASEKAAILLGLASSESFRRHGLLLDEIRVRAQGDDALVHFGRRMAERILSSKDSIDWRRELFAKIRVDRHQCP